MSDDSSKRSYWPTLVAVTTVLALLVGGLAYWKWRAIYTALLYHQPVRLDEAFQKAIASADRIVVRKGGFDCCRPVDKDPVLFVITNKSELQAIAGLLRPVSAKITNSFALAQCGCCGYPGMDWYKGRQRVAVTAVQHGRMLRWKGFSTARVLGFTVGYADCPLTPESQLLLKKWLREHGAADSHLEAASEAVQSPKTTSSGAQANGASKATGSSP
jgi:hypothetical protein